MRVAPKLPQNATVYIVAPHTPHELFVSNLIPMTFFLLLLAFTDGTARTVEVVPQRAMTQLEAPRPGDVLVLDNKGVESYVYDSSLPPFKRTRRYKEGERQQPQHPRGLVSLEGGEEEQKGGGEEEEEEVKGEVGVAVAGGGGAPLTTRKADPEIAAHPPDGGITHGSPAATAATATATATATVIARDRRRRLAAPGDALAATAATADTATVSSNRYLRPPSRDGEGDDGNRRNAASDGGRLGLWSGEAGGGTGGGDEKGERDAGGGSLAELVTAGTGTSPSLGKGSSVGDGGAYRAAADGWVGMAPERPGSALESPWWLAQGTFLGGEAPGTIGGPGYTGREAKEETHDYFVAAPDAVVAGAVATVASGDGKRGLAVQGDGGENEGAGLETVIPAAGAAAGESAGAKTGTEAVTSMLETETVTATAAAAKAAAAALDAGAKSREAEWGGHVDEVEAEAEFFSLSSAASGSRRRPCACARYIGEFGAAPVERGYWFKEEKVENTRARIDALCGDIYRRRWQGGSAEAGTEAERGGPLSNSGGGGGVGGNGDNSRGRKLVIYQRDNDRRLLGLDGNVAVFRELLGVNWQVVPIVHDNAHEPCWLYSQLMDADMLLTPHGFQSMLLLFLPPGATILEVFPYKYWKEGYAPLANEWGVRHEYIMSRPVSWAKRLALFFVPLEVEPRCRRSSGGSPPPADSRGRKESFAEERGVFAAAVAVAAAARCSRGPEKQ
eukprot:jgi/Undpi1/14051/HiC_scaffold_9.g03702.m1